MVGFLSAPFILTGQAFDPARLFTGGEVGDWWLGGAAFQDTGRTTAAAIGDTVASLTGTVNGNHLIQATAAREPTLAANNLLTFGGTHGLYVSSIPWASQVLTFCTILDAPTLMSINAAFFETSANASTTDNTASFFNRNSDDFLVRVTSGGIRAENSAAYTAPNSFILFTEHRNDTTTGDVRLWFSTSEQSLTVTTDTKTNSANFITTSLSFGARDASGTISLGIVADAALALAINRALTADERADIVAEITRLTGIS